MTQEAEKVPAADAGPVVERGVRPLAERLERLAAAYREDYPGQELSAALLQRVRWWCADKAAPSVSAGPDGSVSASWPGLAVRWLNSGAACWTGVQGRSRIWGDGYPDASQWACLRPNVELTGRPLGGPGA